MIISMIVSRLLSYICCKTQFRWYILLCPVYVSIWYIVGRWTYKLIPNTQVWIEERHGAFNFHVMQILTGYECFKVNLTDFKERKTASDPNVQTRRC